MTVLISEQAVVEMAPDNQVLMDARGLIKKGALIGLAKSEDNQLVFGQCKGSGKVPYSVSADFATGGDRPTMRCSCPSQKRPCKHVTALLLAYSNNGDKFPTGTPPADLTEKRAKLIEKKEKAEKPAAETDPKKAAKAAAASKEAAQKKTKEQNEALDTLETFVLDLVNSGLGGLTAKNIQAIDTQAKRMKDAALNGASSALQHLSALVSSEEDVDDDDDEEGKKAARGITELRQARIAQLVTQLWVTIRKGRKVLEGKLEEGTTQGENDAQVESILGRAWKLPELKEAGYWVTDRNLYELAHERHDDQVTEMAQASGYMLDLSDGSVHREWTGIPFNALKFAKLRMSRTGVVSIKEGALYPGDVVNRRVRWEEKPDIVTEHPRTAEDTAKVHSLAKAFEPCFKAFQTQLKNPLDPTDAVFFVKVAKAGTIGEELVIEDAAGARIVMRDPSDGGFQTKRNFAYALGAFGPGSVAVRLWLEPVSRQIYGQALALIVGEKHIRLGM